MKTQEAIDAFGGIKKLSGFLGVWPQSIYKWGDIVPELREYQIKESKQWKDRADKKNG